MSKQLTIAAVFSVLATAALAIAAPAREEPVGEGAELAAPSLPDDPLVG